MENIELINFIDLTIEEKNMVLQWRNTPEVRKWMYNQNEITLQEHLDFIDSLKLMDDKLYFLVKEENDYIGVVDFTQIKSNESLHMGIYANPNVRGKGKLLLEIIIDFSFNKLDVKKIYSEVFQKNVKAYELYERYKFNKIATRKVNNEEVLCLELDYENR